MPQSQRVSATRRFSEPHTDIFTVAVRHEGHEADAIAERVANDVLVGYGSGSLAKRVKSDVLVGYGSGGFADKVGSDVLVGYAVVSVPC